MTAAAALEAKLVTLPTVSKVIDIDSFVPDDQQEKLAIIADANTILAPTLLPHAPPAPITPEQIRLAAKTALAQIDPALAKLPKDHPLAAIAADLRQLQTAPDDVLVATERGADPVPAGSTRPAATVLSAEPVTLASIPPDYRATGCCRMAAHACRCCPTPEARSSQGLRRSSSR